jgi:predicted SprT family Zn-dependent metalloprotease
MSRDFQSTRYLLLSFEFQCTGDRETMARLARAPLAEREDSEDELPDLNIVLAQRRLAIEVNGTAAVATKSKANISIPRSKPEFGNEENEAPSMEIRNITRTEKTAVHEKGILLMKTKAKKRVLRPIGDNPLLKPMSLSMGMASEFMSVREPTKASRSKIREQAKTVERRQNPRTDRKPSPQYRDSTSSENEIQEEPKDIGESDREIGRSKLWVERGARKTSKPEVTTARELSKSKEEDGEEDLEDALNGQILREMEQERIRKSSRSVTIPVRNVSSDVDTAEDDDSDGVSDFIVDDDDSVSEEESEFEIPAPKSTRRLVRGRRPSRSRSPEEVISEFRKSPVATRTGSPKSTSLDKLTKMISTIDLDSSDDERIKGPSMQKPSRGIRKEPEAIPESPGMSSGYDEPPPILKLYEITQPVPGNDILIRRSSPPKSTRPIKIREPARSSTPPPSSPSKNTLVSPTKLKPQRIPQTPHRLSTDAFWSQDIINTWNDEFSPEKPKPDPKRSKSHSSNSSSSSEFEVDDHRDPPPKKSVMQIIKTNKEVAAKRKLFLAQREALAESFLKELDERITSGRISELAASTGGVKIVWNKGLLTTAGRANWKRQLVRRPLSTSDQASEPQYHHHATIELAEKVIDDEDRLLNVLAHEFCHLANFMVSGIRDRPHGKEFQEWARKAGKVFGDRGVEVTTKHGYAIEFKYVWECIECGGSYGRHSKSVDVSRHRCGKCKGLLVQIKPVPRGAGKEGKAGEPKPLNDYQAFVKAHMKTIREQNPGSPQKEIMTIVGARYQEHKALKLAMGVKVAESNDAGVARKLNFLDLSKDD